MELRNYRLIFPAS